MSFGKLSGIGPLLRENRPRCVTENHISQISHKTSCLEQSYLCLEPRLRRQPSHKPDRPINEVPQMLAKAAAFSNNDGCLQGRIKWVSGQTLVRPLGFGLSVTDHLPRGEMIICGFNRAARRRTRSTVGLVVVCAAVVRIREISYRHKRKTHHSYSLVPSTLGTKAQTVEVVMLDSARLESLKTIILR